MVEIVNKKTKEVFVVVCSNSMFEVQIANIETKEIVMISTKELRNDYQLK